MLWLYLKAEGFSEGLAAVSINDKWGYINKNGEFLIEPRFNEALPFTDGLAFVKVGGYDADAVNDVVGGFEAEGKWGYINKAGSYIWSPQIDSDAASQRNPRDLSMRGFCVGRDLIENCLATS
jgi:hypothetical protein